MWNLVLLGLAGAGVIGGCLVPNRWLPPRMPNDKLLHFASFAVLSALALRVAEGHWQAACWLLALFVLGWLIECLQMLVPDRRFSWRDLGANAAGIVFVAVCAQLYAVLA